MSSAIGFFYDHELTGTKYAETEKKTQSPNLTQLRTVDFLLPKSAIHQVCQWKFNYIHDMLKEGYN